MDTAEPLQHGRKKEGDNMTQDVARKKTIEDAARAARNEYKREWYRKNKDKQREYERRYWTKKSQSNKKKTEENGKGGEQS